jgi:hypothetical protein
MLMLATLLLAATAGSPSGGSPGDKPPVGPGFECSAVQVTSAREAGRRRTFSASRSLDLELQTRLDNDRRFPSTLEFRVFTPRGFLYQSLAVAVAPQAPPRRGPARRVSGTLLVAGTAITTNSLYGRWAVEALIDGQPCATRTEFTLTP